MDGVPPAETASEVNKVAGDQDKTGSEDETEDVDARAQSGNGASSSNENG